MAQRVTLAGRLARLEAQRAQAAAGPPSADELQTRFWDALCALVNHAMPREYAERVAAEVQEGTAWDTPSPLTKHVVSLAWQAAYAADSPSGSHPPLAVPREYCELLVAPAPPDADLLFLGLHCTACGLAAPYWEETERGRAWGERVHPCFPTCQHCGAAALAWPHGWLSTSPSETEGFAC
jgi:hypothetical protein